MAHANHGSLDPVRNFLSREPLTGESDVVVRQSERAQIHCVESGLAREIGCDLFHVESDAYATIMTRLADGEPSR